MLCNPSDASVVVMDKRVYLIEQFGKTEVVDARIIDSPLGVSKMFPEAKRFKMIESGPSSSKRTGLPDASIELLEDDSAMVIGDTPLGKDVTNVMRSRMCDVWKIELNCFQTIIEAQDKEPSADVGCMLKDSSDVTPYETLSQAKIKGFFDPDNNMYEQPKLVAYLNNFLGYWPAKDLLVTRLDVSTAWEAKTSSVINGNLKEFVFGVSTSIHSREISPFDMFQKNMSRRKFKDVKCVPPMVGDRDVNVANTFPGFAGKLIVASKEEIIC
jgi:hypothetical protein